MCVGLCAKPPKKVLFDCKDSAVVSTIQITTAIPNTVYPAQGQWPAPVTKQPDIKNPKLTKDQRTTGSPARKTIIITVKSVTSDTIHISWKLVLIVQHSKEITFTVNKSSYSVEHKVNGL